MMMTGGWFMTLLYQHDTLLGDFLRAVTITHLQSGSLLCCSQLQLRVLQRIHPCCEDNTFPFQNHQPKFLGKSCYFTNLN